MLCVIFLIKPTPHSGSKTYYRHFIRKEKNKFLSNINWKNCLYYSVNCSVYMLLINECSIRVFHIYSEYSSSILHFSQKYDPCMLCFPINCTCDWNRQSLAHKSSLSVFNQLLQPMDEYIKLPFPNQHFKNFSLIIYPFGHKGCIKKKSIKRECHYSGSYIHMRSKTCIS